MRKKEWIPYLLGGIVLVVASIYDYQITDTLYMKLPWLGMVFERFLLIPIILIPAFTFMCHYQQKKQIRYFVLALLGCLYSSFDALHYWLLDEWLYVFVGGLTIVEFVLLYAIGKKLSRTTLERILPFVTFYTKVLLSSIIIVNVIKFGWGRVRYRDLQETAQFCNWYFPCGASGNYSFPSGHSTAFASIICFLQFPKENRFKRNPKWLYVLLTLLIVAMPISRMIMGAHYLSDTTVGIMVTYTMYLIFRNFYRKLGYL